MWDLYPGVPKKHPLVNQKASEFYSHVELHVRPLPHTVYSHFRTPIQPLIPGNQRKENCSKSIIDQCKSIELSYKSDLDPRSPWEAPTSQPKTLKSFPVILSNMSDLYPTQFAVMLSEPRPNPECQATSAQGIAQINSRPMEIQRIATNQVAFQTSAPHTTLSHKRWNSTAFGVMVANRYPDNSSERWEIRNRPSWRGRGDKFC